jgi:hypothetical protein
MNNFRQHGVEDELGLKGTALGVATSHRGAWRVAAQPELHRALTGTSHRLAEDASSQANHSGGWLHFAKTEK